MIRKTLMAAAVALTAGVVAIPMDAGANHRSWHDNDDDVDVRLQFGFGSPGYYGDPRYYNDYPRHRRGYNRISCGEARSILRDRGYHRIRTRECSGRTYSFRANRNGRTFVMYVNSRNGNVWRG